MTKETIKEQGNFQSKVSSKEAEVVLKAVKADPELSYYEKFIRADERKKIIEEIEKLDISNNRLKNIEIRREDWENLKKEFLK